MVGGSNPAPDFELEVRGVRGSCKRVKATFSKIPFRESKEKNRRIKGN